MEGDKKQAIGYITSFPGIVRLSEIIFSILTFAISFGGGYVWNVDGGGWVEFVGIFATVVSAIFFFQHLLNLIPDIFNRFYIEPIACILISIMFFIAGVVAAAKASYYNSFFGNTNEGNCVGASSFLAFLCCVLFALDAVLHLTGSFGFGSQRTTVDVPASGQAPPENTSHNAVY